MCSLCVFYFICTFIESDVRYIPSKEIKLNEVVYDTFISTNLTVFQQPTFVFIIFAQQPTIHKLRFENYWRLMCAWQRVRKHFRWISFGTSIKQRPRTPSADNCRECWLRKIDQSQSNLKWIALILGSSSENIDKFQSNERMVRSSDRQSGLWISHQIIIINAYT